MLQIVKVELLPRNVVEERLGRRVNAPALHHRQEILTQHLDPRILMHLLDEVMSVHTLEHI
jgi:hypothetical protein